MKLFFLFNIFLNNIIYHAYEYDVEVYSKVWERIAESMMFITGGRTEKRCWLHLSRTLKVEVYKSHFFI